MKNYLLIAVFTGLSLSSFSQVWVERDSLPTPTPLGGPFSFSIGGKLYVGGGSTGSNALNGFYQYDPATNTWATMADVPITIESTYGFVLNGMGYLVGGWNGSNLSSSVYMYNPGTNTWTQKNNFAGAARQNEDCFSANGFGYVFGGFTGGSIVVSDMWQYNDTTDSWRQMASCPGPGRNGPTFLVINDQIYVGLGAPSGNFPVYSDFYRFDPVANTYTPVDSMPATRTNVAHFSIGNLGYVGLGHDPVSGTFPNDFYTFDPATNSWAQIDSFNGPARAGMFSETVNGVGYIGCGVTYNSVFFRDCWSYGFPESVQSIAGKGDAALSCYPSPTSEGFTIDMAGYGTGDRQISVFDQLGQVVFKTVSSQNKIQVSNKLLPGAYIVSVAQGAQQGYSKIVVE